MKFIIEDAPYTFEVDWAKRASEDGITDPDYFPLVLESFEAFCRLLENLYPATAIADCLASGELAALDYSHKGVVARDLLRGK